jgi:hypothetical protein
MRLAFSHTEGNSLDLLEGLLRFATYTFRDLTEGRSLDRTVPGRVGFTNCIESLDHGLRVLVKGFYVPWKNLGAGVTE